MENGANWLVNCQAEIILINTITENAIRAHATTSTTKFKKITDSPKGVSNKEWVVLIKKING